MNAETEGTFELSAEDRATYRAEELGTVHGELGCRPYGRFEDAGSARLMTDLGETAPTTQENHYFRLSLLDAYVEAWEQAADADYDQH